MAKDECTHSVNEKETARIDGLCPLCLKAEVEQLKKALKKYGRHISCACRHTLVNRKGKWKGGGTEKRRVAAKCDCGFEQALKGKVDNGR